MRSYLNSSNISFAQSVLQLSIDINTIMIHEFIKYLNLMTEVFLYILNELSA